LRRDSDFIEGRWLTPWDLGVSKNFSFVANEGMARLLRIAEANLHIDPNTTLIKLRQFGELLTHHAAPRFGVYPGSQERQIDLLARLRSPKGFASEVLDALHDLRKRGNEAVHEHTGDRYAAVQALKSAQRLAFWFERQVEGRSISRPKFQRPQDPRKMFAAVAEELEAAKAEAQRHAATAAEVEAAANSVHQLAVEQRAAKEEAEADRQRWVEEAQTWKLLAEEQEAAASPASLARRLEALREDLRRLDPTGATGAGLPDWVAAVIAGDEPPMELPDELVEDLRALAGVLPVPAVQAPSVMVESEGNLAASAKVPLQIRPSLRNPDSLNSAERQGAIWVDTTGNEFLVPQRLRSALDALQDGPPVPEDGESPAEATKRRQLWWGRLRRELEAFDVNLKGYLLATDAVVLDRLRPRLVIRDDGQFEVRFASDVLTEDETTTLVDSANLHSSREPTLRSRGADGSIRRRKVILSPTGRKAIHRAQTVRSMKDSAGPFLRDAIECVFDPELFDLSEYSDRVVGVGRPVYRVFQSVIGTDGRYRFGLTPSPGSDDASPPELTPEEQAELARLLAQAARAGHSYIPFRDGWVRVPTPERAREMTENVGPVRRGGVLIVEENTEDLEFAPDDSGDGGRAVVPERPPGLVHDVSLMSHQFEGLSWLAGHAALVDGASDHGLLADDMGLGKTLQVLSLMSLLQDAGKLQPSLVVAPLSLLENWEREAARFFPDRFQRWLRLAGGVRQNARQLRQYEVVLVSYDTLRSQQLELGRVRWKLMVCDECHRIRNPTALTTRAILAMDAARRIGLTGTPVQNSLVDIWSQLNGTPSG